MFKKSLPASTWTVDGKWMVPPGRGLSRPKFPLGILRNGLIDENRRLQVLGPWQRFLLSLEVVCNDELNF